MAFESYSSSSHSYFNRPSNGARREGSPPSRLALDNLIRRELRVSDPNNATEVAEALFARYRETPQAIAIDSEAEGMPYIRTPQLSAPKQPVETSSDAELDQAMNDVERDLQELTSNAILKDVAPELQGWAMAIRSAMTEGFYSARFAIDSSQRDKTFGIRRTLGDYARMARLVGALSSPVVNVNYRNLAQSIDEVTAVLLVMMGESLANVSFNRSRFLLQVPYSELQARRDSVIYALRNFIGSTQEAYAPNEWPRGVDAYRQLYKALDEQGQGDLRALLVENELARLMDSLIQRASQGNAEGLRQLGATAQLDIPRLRRLVIVASRTIVVNPKSPPLTAFLEALQLFIDAFESAGGFRLLRLARPPILFYGLYGSSSDEQASENLLVQLAIERNRLAELLDCLARCGCSSEDTKCLIVLDKVLYDVDRAIDLFALGTSENSEPEQRAVAYSYVVDSIIRDDSNNTNGISSSCFNAGTDLQSSMTDLRTSILDTLNSIRSILFERAASLAPGQDLPEIGELGLDTNIEATMTLLVDQELCIQQDTEKRWIDLVQTMSPGCIPLRARNNSVGVFDVINLVITDARKNALGDEVDPCEVGNFNLPRQYEFSLSAQANSQSIIEANVEDISDTLRRANGLDDRDAT
ncbi:MAG: hypothetical protein AB4050_13315 [Synechococcus sp.]